MIHDEHFAQLSDSLSELQGVAVRGLFWSYPNLLNLEFDVGPEHEPRRFEVGVLMSEWVFLCDGEIRAASQDAERGLRDDDFAGGFRDLVGRKLRGVTMRDSDTSLVLAFDNNESLIVLGALYAESQAPEDIVWELDTETTRYTVLGDGTVSLEA